MPEQVGLTAKSTSTRTTPSRPITGSARQTGKSYLPVTVPGGGAGRGALPNLICEGHSSAADHALSIRVLPVVRATREGAVSPMPLGTHCWLQQDSSNTHADSSNTQRSEDHSEPPGKFDRRPRKGKGGLRVALLIERDVGTKGPATQEKGPAPAVCCALAGGRGGGKGARYAVVAPLRIM